MPHIPPTSVESILAHFSDHDPVIYQVLIRSGVVTLTPPPAATAYFERLCRSIVGQQLSTKVAEVIYARFKHLFPQGEVTPAGVLALTDDTLRAVGLSWGKVKYLKDLATRADEGSIPFDRLAELDNEQVIEELTQVKGIGRWTVEMFLMFTLGRPDVFSKGDLGLRRGMQKLYGLEEAEWFDRVDEIVAQWSPYKTYAALAVWHSLDNQPQ